MRGQSGMPGNEYADGMIEHDGDVGKLLKALDDLGIANNTIVVYTTDNGPNQFSWPDAATTPFRSEKDTNWEGAFRVPADGPLARAYQAGRGRERDILRPRLVSDLRLRRLATRRSRIVCSRAPTSAARRFGCTSTATISSIYLTGKNPKSASDRLRLFRRRR